MASITQTNLQSGLLTGGMNRVAKAYSDAKQAYARYRVYSVTLNELQNLSSRELDDLGISKSMLKRVAYDAAYAG